MEKTPQELAGYWWQSAESNRLVAEDLFKLKHYDWSLFLWHLAIEKSLKAKIAAIGKEIPYVHDLLRLAKEANLPTTGERAEQLNEITTFNIEARYDDYKRAFYKKANKPYTEKWSAVCREIIQWIKSQ